jgi:serine/threonine-protein kinase
VGRATGDRTKQGTLDLAGNVREWCRDVSRPYRDDRQFFDPVERPSDGELDPEYVIRGGSYDTPIEMSRTTCRSYSGDKQSKARADEPVDDVGFRLVLEVVVIPDPASLHGAGPAKPKEQAR